MFTQVRSANRRVSPAEDNKHKVVIKAVYVVLEPQYQNSLTEAAKLINQTQGPIGIELNGYLIKPAKWIKGTKMAFAGLRKEKDRASVIKYLNQNSDNPLQLP